MFLDSSFEEIIALQALVRPGALKHSKVHEKFVNAEKKRRGFNYPHKLLSLPILKETFGELYIKSK